MFLNNKQQYCQSAGERNSRDMYACSESMSFVDGGMEDKAIPL